MTSKALAADSRDWRLGAASCGHRTVPLDGLGPRDDRLNNIRFQPELVGGEVSPSSELRYVFGARRIWGQSVGGGDILLCLLTSVLGGIFLA